MYLGLGLCVKISIVIFPHSDTLTFFSCGCRLKPNHVKPCVIFSLVWIVCYLCGLIGAHKHNNSIEFNLAVNCSNLVLGIPTSQQFYWDLGLGFSGLGIFFFCLIGLGYFSSTRVMANKREFLPVKLDRKNYFLWEFKLSFMERNDYGTLLMDLLQYQMIANNIKVISWILSSIEPHISLARPTYTTARDTWSHLC